MSTRTRPSPAEQHTKFKQYAESKGGQLLSAEYTNSKSKLHFRCAENHEWSVAASSIWHQQSWCGICSQAARGARVRQKNNFLGELQKIVAAKGGECLATGSVRSQEKVPFRCGAGHEWTANASAVKCGSWCPYCMRKKIADPLGELKEVAATRGGECLSEAYVGSDKKLLFSCADGHQWEARPNDIRRGTWCPSCSNRSEGLVRQFLECAFGIELPPKRQSWLVDTDGKQRILDGYCAEKQFAFEYHGEQHSSHVDFFHNAGTTNSSLGMQQKRDAFVREACAGAGVTLLEIYALPDGYSREAFVAHMQAAIESLPGAPALAAGGLEKFLAMPFGVTKLQQLQEIAAARGGKCLSKQYIATNSKMEWQCAEGHTWAAIPKTVKKGIWCPFCSGCRRQTPLQDAHDIAKSHGGVCHSTEYKNIRTQLAFTCKNGHNFTTAASSIFHQKSWCGACARNRVDNPLGRLRKIAEGKGGTLLSTDYINSRTKVSLRCAVGHEWSTTPVALTQFGSWCKRCACRDNAIKVHEARRQQGPASRNAAKKKPDSARNQAQITVDVSVEFAGHDGPMFCHQPGKAVVMPCFSHFP